MKKFKLKGYHEDEWYWVYIYDSLKEMRQETDKYCAYYSDDEDNSNVLAVCHCYTRKFIHPDGSETIKNNIGIIRFSKTHLFTHIVAHELVHAAMHHYRLTQPTRIASFGRGNNQKEEDYGHIYAKYFSRMSRKLHLHGFWK